MSVVAGLVLVGVISGWVVESPDYVIINDPTPLVSVLLVTPFLCTFWSVFIAIIFYSYLYSCIGTCCLTCLPTFYHT